MTRWEEFYRIVPYDSEDKPGFWSIYSSTEKWQIIDNFGVVVGTYNDRKYAVKQAKYKFKKIMSRVERTLLG